MGFPGCGRELRGPDMRAQEEETGFDWWEGGKIRFKSCAAVSCAGASATPPDAAASHLRGLLLWWKYARVNE